jgi:integral membrane protein
MTALKVFRTVAFLEGTSYLVLLLVAMPLKYLLAMPLAVRVVGSIHGFLFVLFVLLLLRVATERQWPLLRSGWALLASVLPGGTFVFDRTLQAELARCSEESAQQH